MRQQTGLVRRGSTYYLRVRVPAELRSHYKGSEIKRTLHTKDLPEARSHAEAERSRVLAEFTALRQGAPQPKALASLSDAEISHLCRAWLHDQLAGDDQKRALGLIDPEEQERSLDEGEHAVIPALKRGDPAGLALEVARLLREHGLSIPLHSESWRQLEYALAQTAGKLHKALRARDRGELAETPARPAQLPRVGESMDALLAYWRSQADRRPNTVREFATAVKQWNALHPNLPVQQVTRAHVVAFRDELLKSNNATKRRSPRTVKKTLSLLRAIAQTAMDAEKLPANPFIGVKIARPKVEAPRRNAFSAADLKLIFSSPIYTEGKRPKAGAGEAAFWLPLLGLYTGARLGEVGQLRCADVKEKDDIPYIEITDEAEGTSLKTESSRRRVPIHPQLIVKWKFLDYVETRRKDGADASLFPALREDSRGVLTGGWGKWFSRYLRGTIKIKDARKVFHSFRHTFVTICRECGIDEETRSALTGHRLPGVGRSYGEMPLVVLAKAMARVSVLPEGIPTPAADKAALATSSDGQAP